MRFLLYKPSQQQAASQLLTHINHPNNGYHLDMVDTLLDLSRQLHTDAYHLLFLQLTSDATENDVTVAAIRNAHPHIPLVVLGDGLPAEEAAKVLKTGADEFFSTAINPQEMDARIEALLRRSTIGANNVVACGPLQYDRTNRVASLNNIPIALSPRETLVLEIFINTPGRPVNKDRLIHVLFGSYNAESVNAVEVYVHRLRRKLQHKSLRIRTMRSNGYILEWETPETDPTLAQQGQPQ